MSDDRWLAISRNAVIAFADRSSAATGPGRSGRLKITLVLALLSLSLGACQTTASRQEARCAAPDNVSRVQGGDICFGMTTYLHEQSQSPTMVVYLHGDVSRGGPAAYMHQFAYRPHEAEVTIVLLRPGYDDGRGNRSSGSDCGRSDCYTAENVDAIADAIKTLRSHHGAKKVILVGHSGGAAISAILIGRHAGVADAAILASCPCDLTAWRSYRGSRWTKSLNPLGYADQVPVETAVVALTGSTDHRTPPELAQRYVERLAQRGVRARFELEPGAGHSFRSLGTSAAFRSALTEMSRP